MSSEPGSESFFCGLRPIPRILSLGRRGHAVKLRIANPLLKQRLPELLDNLAGGGNVRIQNDYRATSLLDAPLEAESQGVARRSGGDSLLYDGDAQIKQTIQSGFESQFKKAAGDPEAFQALMKEAYGENYDRAAAESFRRRALSDDFSWLPKMEFRSND